MDATVLAVAVSGARTVLDELLFKNHACGAAQTWTGHPCGFCEDLFTLSSDTTYLMRTASGWMPYNRNQHRYDGILNEDEALPDFKNSRQPHLLKYGTAAASQQLHTICYECWSRLAATGVPGLYEVSRRQFVNISKHCLLYTSDAADE